MAWTAPRTWVSGETLTAALLNTHLRDNISETASAKAAAAGDIFVATAANALKVISLGTARQVAQVNAGATDVEWTSSVALPGKLTLSDGGTVTQITSKATGVTLNTHSGQITMHNASLAAGAEVTFTVTNSTVAATDTVITNHGSAGTTGAYGVHANNLTAGTFDVTVSNLTGGALGEAIVINFVVIGGSAT
jgi:hypothetical protein